MIGRLLLYAADGRGPDRLANTGNSADPVTMIVPPDLALGPGMGTPRPLSRGVRETEFRPGAFPTEFGNEESCANVLPRLAVEWSGLKLRPPLGSVDAVELGLDIVPFVKGEPAVNATSFAWGAVVELGV